MCEISSESDDKERNLICKEKCSVGAVSYTHLDVYKRQLVGLE